MPADSSPSRRRTVTLSYANAGTVPPVFVAGSFSSPPWQPLEMTAAKQLRADGSETSEYEFRRDVTVSEGIWQYKFRLGHGDWWVLDERAETTTDDAGNMNNMMVVRLEEQAAPAALQPPSSSPSPASPDAQSVQPVERAPAGPAELDTPTSTDDSQPTSSEWDNDRTDATSPMPSNTPSQYEAEDAALDEEDFSWSNSAPMLPHERITDHASPSPSDHLPDLLEENETGPDEDHEHSLVHDQADPQVDEHVLPHGQITFSLDPPTPTDAPMQLPSEDVAKLVLGPALDDAPLPTESMEADDGSPLLTPTGSEGLVTDFLDHILHADEDEDTRVEHAPLFAYECMSGCEEGFVRPAVPSLIHVPLSADTPAPVEIDISALEEFPSDGQRVFKFIEEAEARLTEDITSDDDSKLSSPSHMPGTPVDTYFSHHHPQRLSPKGEQAQHLAQIPEECVLPDLAMDVSSPTRIAFHVQPSDGIILDQDGLFDVPRRIHSCRRASNDWADVRPTPSAHGSSGSIADVDGTLDRDVDAQLEKNAAGAGSVTSAGSVSVTSAAAAKPKGAGEEESSSSKASPGESASQNPASNEALRHRKHTASTPSLPDEPVSLSLSSLPKAVVSFHEGNTTTPRTSAQFDGVHSLHRDLSSSAPRHGRMASYAVVTSAIALCLYLYCR